MKILSISVDNSVFEKDSAVAKRIVEYGEMVDKYIVLVPVKKTKENIFIKLSDKVFAYGVSSGNSLVGLFNVFKLAKKNLKEEKFDLITVGDQYYLAFLGWILAKKFSIGLNLQIHGFEKYSGFRKLLAKFVIPRADSIRVVSQRLKKQLIEEFGVRKEKITVVPIYVERVTRNVERVTRNDSKFVFLTVGRLVAVKNIGLQIEAIKEVTRNAERVTGVELWIVGDGPERKNLALLVTRYSLQDHVKFFGWQEDVGKFYEQADVFLLTSHYEGWGMAVIEAASYGLPIIMTDVGCAGEVIKNSENGLVVTVGDKDRLIEVMIKLMEDNDLRRKLGAGARRAIEKLPSKDETLRLYKENWEKTDLFVNINYNE